MNDIPNLKKFKLAGEIFLNSLLNEMTTLGLPSEALKSDHLCFRVETEEQYKEYKYFLNQEALLLTESTVNGRPIATFSLPEPFKVGSQTVSVVELPSPKKGTDYKIGFEHAEFVINESFEFFSRQHPNLEFTRSGNKNFNPELCLKTKVGTAKFHHLALERIIEIEQANLKDIIFDLDGTLIQSRNIIYEINRIVFSKLLGRRISLKESIEKFHPEFPTLLRAFGVSCHFKQSQAIASWSEVSQRFTYLLFDGIKDLLIRLRKQGFNLHLWTARDEKSALAILAHHNVASLFETMSFATDCASKPDSKSLKLDWQTKKKNSVLIIGDSPTDIFAAKNIGAVGVAAMWDPHVQRHSLINSGAELFFSEIEELESWILSKSGGI